MTVLCYPLIFEVSDFYLYHDMALLIDDIKTELQFVGRYWRLSGRPTVCLLVREEHMRDPQFKRMLDLMAMLKKGHCDGVKVRIGRLQNLISSSCVGTWNKVHKYIVIMTTGLFFCRALRLPGLHGVSPGRVLELQADAARLHRLPKLDGRAPGDGR